MEDLIYFQIGKMKFKEIIRENMEGLKRQMKKDAKSLDVNGKIENVSKDSFQFVADKKTNKEKLLKLSRMIHEIIPKNWGIVVVDQEKSITIIKE